MQEDTLPAPEGNILFQSLSRRMYLLRRDYPDMACSTSDTFFLAYLLECSQFGRFNYGPITIDVSFVEEAFAQTYPRGRFTTGVPFDESARSLLERVSEEHRRSGRPRVDELHWLLAFMRTPEGLPARVFGELGVSPEAIEAYAGAHTLGDPMREALYSPEEVAAHLGVQTQTVRAWIRTGRLPASRLAGQRVLRIKASDVATLLEPVQAEGTTPAGGKSG